MTLFFKPLKSILVITLALFMLTPMLALAIYVPIDYPGLLDEDNNLPGIPSSKPEKYIDELVYWAKWFNDIPLTKTMATNVIYEPYHAGFRDENGDIESPKYKYTDKDGQDQEGVYYDANMPIWQFMRDIIFLETLKRSVEHWDDTYIQKISKEDVNITDIYNQAQEILKVFKEYEEDSLFSQSHNPFITAFVGAGGTSYGLTMKDIFLSDGTLDSYVDGRMVYLMESVPNAMRSGNYSGVIDFGFDRLGKTQLVVDYMINLYGKSGGDSGIAKMAAVLTGGVFDVLSGGLVMVLAPAKAYYNAIDYLKSGLENASKAAYLVNYYYLFKNYPQEVINYGRTATFSFIDGDGILDFNAYPLFEYELTAAGIKEDLILKTLTSKDYHFNTYIKDKKAVTSLKAQSDILLQAISFDIEYLKREVAAFAYVTYAKKHKRFGETTTINVEDLTGNNAKLERADLFWDNDSSQYLVRLELRLPEKAFESNDISLEASSRLPLNVELIDGAYHETKTISSSGDVVIFKVPFNWNNKSAVFEQKGLIGEYTLNTYIQNQVFQPNGKITHTQALRLEYADINAHTIPYVEIRTKNGVLNLNAGDEFKICPKNNPVDLTKWGKEALVYYHYNNERPEHQVVGTIEGDCVKFVAEETGQFALIGLYPSVNGDVSPDSTLGFIWLGTMIEDIVSDIVRFL